MRVNWKEITGWTLVGLAVIYIALILVAPSPGRGQLFEVRSASEPPAWNESFYWNTASAESCGDIEKRVSEEFEAACSGKSLKLEPCDSGCTLPADTVFHQTKKGSGDPLCGHSGILQGGALGTVYVSHVHVCRDKQEPPPECEPGDPCWCEENPSDPACQPEPSCDLTLISFEQTNFSFGFTQDLNAPDGAGCGNDDLFTGTPGDQVRFDACLDGYANGGVILSPELPYHWSEIVTVGQQSDVVSGTQEVIVVDPDYESCEKVYRYAWVGSVAADTGTELCLPTEPCWCESVPGDPRCKTPCSSYADIRIAIIEGHDEEACYQKLQNGSVFHSSPSGEWTICWNALAGEASAKAGGSSFLGLPKKSYAFLTGALSGWLAATDIGDGCSDYDRLDFQVVTDPPGICLPWLD